MKAKRSQGPERGSNLRQRKQYACVQEFESSSCGPTPLWGGNPVLNWGISEMPWAWHMCRTRVSQAALVPRPAPRPQDTHSHPLRPPASVMRSSLHVISQHDTYDSVNGSRVMSCWPIPHYATWCFQIGGWLTDERVWYIHDELLFFAHTHKHRSTVCFCRALWWCVHEWLLARYEILICINNALMWRSRQQEFKPHWGLIKKFQTKFPKNYQHIQIHQERM